MITRKPVSLWHLIKRMRLYFLAIPLLVTLVFGALALQHGARIQGLWREGVVVDALVLEREIIRQRDSDGKETLRYFLRYSYVPAWQVTAREQRQAVSRRLYDATHEGQIIPATHALSQPERVSVDLDHDRFGMIMLTLISTVALCVTVGLGWWLLGRKFSAIRALRYGEVRQARVTALQRTNTTINNRPQYRLTWRDAAGQDGQSMMGDYDSLSKLPIGSVIIVYIDPRTGTGWWEDQIA